MEKEIKEIKNAKIELSNLKREFTLLQEAETQERGRRASDYRLENLTSKGVEFFKKQYKEEFLDSSSFKRKTRKYMEKKLSTYKLNNIPEERVITEFLEPLFKSYKNTVEKYREIQIV